MEAFARQATRLSFPVEFHVQEDAAEQTTNRVIDVGPSHKVISRSASDVSLEPPPPPPKDNIRTREELIKAKKREARRREEEENFGTATQFHARDTLLARPRSVSRSRSRSPAGNSLGMGRPSRRRSMSTGDAEDLLATRPGAATRRASALRSEPLLDVVPMEEDEAPLADSIDHELKKLSESSSTVSCVVSTKSYALTAEMYA